MMMENSTLKELRTFLKRYPKEVKDYFSGLLSFTPFEFIIINKELEIIYLSPLIREKCGYKQDELAGSSLETIFPETWQGIKHEISAKNNSRRTEIKSVKIRTKPGGNIYGSATVACYCRKNIELYCVFLTNLEVKKKHSFLQDNIQSCNFFNKMTGRGLWMLNYNSRQFSGNNECFYLLGIKTQSGSVPFSEVLGTLYSSEEKENLEKDIIRLERDNSMLSCELRIKTTQGNANNNFRYVRLTMQRPEIPGLNVLAGTMDDITFFKHTEKELVKSRARLEKADRFKSVFLSNLSHEIRTPMNAILGYSELLSLPGLSQKEVSDYTSIIRSRGNYLLTLIDDASELSKFESGNIEFRYSEFLLLPLLKDLAKEFDQRRVEKGKNNIEIIMDVPADAESQIINTDYGRLHQLLANLLSNALKFTEKGQIIFGYKLSSKNFKFFVSDTGIGLTKEDEKKIFQRFETLEDTTLRKLSGTGLSLTISKYIAEQLGGRIKVKSEINKGSRFQLNIPVAFQNHKKLAVAEDRDTILSFNWKDKVILIGEDEDINFKFLEAVLQKTQVQILRAKNGQEVVDLCRKINHIDLVLLDIKMPVMSGYDAAIEIKKYRTNLPIIAQTAFSAQDEIIKCQQVGCDDYITKPIDINILVEKINRQFHR